MTSPDRAALADELLARADKYLNTGSGEYASEIMRDMAKFIASTRSPSPSPSPSPYSGAAGEALMYDDLIALISTPLPRGAGNNSDGAGRPVEDNRLVPTPPRSQEGLATPATVGTASETARGDNRDGGYVAKPVERPETPDRLHVPSAPSEAHPTLPRDAVSVELLNLERAIAPPALSPSPTSVMPDERAVESGDVK